MKGIVLAGGTGSRLWPVTFSLSKQLLPVYDKPMIYYPLSTLMLSGIREILIITNPGDLMQFQQLLGDGSQWGISIEYKTQLEPRGLVDAFLIGQDFLDGDEVCLILGDNLFYGSGLGRQLSDIRNLQGCHIFGYRVAKPQSYGILSIDETNSVFDVQEKPKQTNSNMAITGLYFFSMDVCELAKGVKQSPRGELEITDLIRIYLHQDRLKWTELQRGTVWMDMGTHKDLMATSNFVATIEDRQNQKIACLEEIAYNNGWISQDEIKFLAKKYEQSPYFQYLNSII